MSKVDVTSTPSKDLTDDKLDGYDVLILNYFNTAQGAPESQWSDANKSAFLKAVREKGKGLVVVHHASGAFAKPNWADFEKAIAGGWRTQGFHGPAYEFTVKKTDFDHPISKGAPAKFVRPRPPTSCIRTRCSPPAASCSPPPIATPASPRGRARTRP